MRVGSVCSGIGAATLAWETLPDWRMIFESEIEAFPRAVLHHHRPHVPIHGDFTTINAGDYEQIELLVGGTPCQSFSIAGLRRGMADARGNLALQYILLADRLRPKWVVWENVPGVFSSKPGSVESDEEGEGPGVGHNGGPVFDDGDAIPGEDFAAFLSGLVRWDVGIPEGGWRNSGVISPAPVDGAYGVAWRVLDAQHFGVPQRRRRVFVVGYSGDWRPSAAVLLERHCLSGDSAPRREKGARTSHSLAARAGGGGRPDGGDGRHDQLETAGTLAGGARKDGGYSADDIPLTVGALTSAHGPNGHGGSGLATDKGAEAGHILAWGGNNRSGPIDVAASLSANKTGSGQFYDFTVETFITEGRESEPLSIACGCGEVFFGELNTRCPACHTLRDAQVTYPPSRGGADPVAFDTTQITHPENRSNPQPGDPCHPLAAQGHAPAVAYSIMPMNSGKDFKAREVDVAQPVTAGPSDKGNQGGDYVLAFALRGRDDGNMPEVCEDGQVASALRAASGGSTRDMVAFAPQAAGKQTALGYNPGAGTVQTLGANQTPAVAGAAAVRRLTPTECERLQGFPDGFTAIPWRGKPASECVDGPRYKALGNSMAVPVMRYIGERIALVDAALRAGEDPGDVI